LKIFNLVVLFVFSLYAGVMNGIGVVVNDEPITLYQIDKAMQEYKISKAKAIELLIGEKLKDKIINDFGIAVTNNEIDERMIAIAKMNNLTLPQFEDILQSRFISLEDYKKNIKKQILQEKLARRILRDEMVLVDDEDVKLYYQNHNQEFNIPVKIKVIKYASHNKGALLKFLNNPMLNIQEVINEEEEIVVDDLSPKLKSLVLQTDIGSFTPVLPVANLYISVYIKEYLQTKQETLEDVKSKIKQKLFKENESKAIEQYFQKQRLKADVVFVN